MCSIRWSGWHDRRRRNDVVLALGVPPEGIDPKRSSQSIHVSRLITLLGTPRNRTAGAGKYLFLVWNGGPLRGGREQPLAPARGRVSRVLCTPGSANGRAAGNPELPYLEQVPKLQSRLGSGKDGGTSATCRLAVSSYPFDSNPWFSATDPHASDLMPETG